MNQFHAPGPYGQPMHNYQNGNMQGNAQNQQHRPNKTDHSVNENNQNADNLNRQSYMNIKSHGNKNAVEVAPDETTKGWHTIRLEGAPKRGDGSKAYAWDKKVSIQLTKTELPIVIGTLLGYLPECSYKNHGGDANKWFSMENQGANFYFKIGQSSTKTMMPCPVPTVEAHLMGMLALSQYVKNFDNMSAEAALEAIKTMSGHMLRNKRNNNSNQSQ